MVIAGNNKGKKGRVLEIITKTERAIVEGVNMMKKHTKPNAESPQGGIIEKEAPVHISNLMLFDAKAGVATRIGRRLNDQGKLVRFSKKSGEEIK
jgi:large subunit ribosomal protein L24